MEKLKLLRWRNILLKKLSWHIKQVSLEEHMGKILRYEEEEEMCEGDVCVKEIKMEEKK